MRIAEWLERHPQACQGAREWLPSLGPDATMNEAWLACERPDWMIWALLHGSSVTDWRPLVRWACDRAERSLLAERAAGRYPDARSWAGVFAAREYMDGRISETVARTAVAAAAAAWWAADEAWWATDEAESPAAKEAWIAAASAEWVHNHAAEAWVHLATEELWTDRWAADRLRMYYVPAQGLLTRP